MAHTLLSVNQDAVSVEMRRRMLTTAAAISHDVHVDNTSNNISTANQCGGFPLF